MPGSVSHSSLHDQTPHAQEALTLSTLFIYGHGDNITRTQFAGAGRKAGAPIRTLWCASWLQQPLNQHVSQ